MIGSVQRRSFAINRSGARARGFETAADGAGAGPVARAEFEKRGAHTINVGGTRPPPVLQSQSQPSGLKRSRILFGCYVAQRGVRPMLVRRLPRGPRGEETCRTICGVALHLFRRRFSGPSYSSIRAFSGSAPRKKTSASTALLSASVKPVAFLMRASVFLLTCFVQPGNAT